MTRHRSILGLQIGLMWVKASRLVIHVVFTYGALAVMPPVMPVCACGWVTGLCQALKLVLVWQQRLICGEVVK